MIGYIYKITSPTNKVYIGQTIDVERRRKEYAQLKCKSQKKLYYSLRKHGWEKHTFEVLIECEESELNKLERYYQDLYNCISANVGLNLKLTGTNDRSGRYSKELRAKMSGKNHPMYGKTHTRESRDKISKIHKGKKISEEHKRSASEILKVKHSGEGNPFYGKTHTEENKLKSSIRVSGGNNPRSIMVFDTYTGIFYDTITDAGKAIGISYDLMRYRINKKIHPNYILV